jgi:dipeptidyl aminopeptidase/acylaminoacyl peptidase
MMMRTSCRIVALALLLSLSGLEPLAGTEQESTSGEVKSQTPRNPTVDDYFRLKRVRDPQPSPDGKWVAYTVDTANLKEDKWEKQVWMIPTAGGEAVPMTAKGSSASSPRWSPDGQYLAFLAARNKEKSQVWTLFRQGGDSQQLSDVRQGVEAFEWAPDGRRLVLVIQDPSPEDLAAEKAEKEGKEFKPKTPPPKVIDRLQFKMDYEGYLDRRRTHLYVFDMATKKMTQITSGDYDDSQPAWSKDGRFIAFVSNRSENADANYNTDIWVVAADNPDKGRTLLQVTTNPGPDRSPAWSPDGRWITYVSATDVEAMVYATPHLAVVPAEGGTPRVLTEKVDRHVYSPKFSADSQSIYFLLEDSAEQHLARIPVGGSDVSRPIAGQRSVQDFELGADGSVVALISLPTLPEEIFVLNNGKLAQLTSTNAAVLAELRLAEVENIRHS